MDVSAIRPGGYLLQLPREVRDQIYGDYFNGTYPVIWSYHISEDDESQRDGFQGNDSQDDDAQDDGSQNDDTPDDRPQDDEPQACLQHPPTNLAVLQTSKVLHNDVKGFLLSKAASKVGTYKYVIDLAPRENFSNPPFKEATDHMTNVMFEVRVHPERTAARAEADGYEIKTISGVSFMNSICEATIDRFVGTAVIRESFRIIFKADFVKFNQSFRYFMKTRFFRALEGLTGFKNVTVVLEWSVISKSDSRLEVQKGVRKVLLGLGRHLGLPDIKSAAYRTDEVDQTTTYFVAELEFEPRNFHARRLRAEAVKLTKEASGLRTKAKELTKKALRLTREANRVEG